MTHAKKTSAHVYIYIYKCIIKEYQSIHQWIYTLTIAEIIFLCQKISGHFTCHQSKYPPIPFLRRHYITNPNFIALFFFRGNPSTTKQHTSEHQLWSRQNGSHFMTPESIFITLSFQYDLNYPISISAWPNNCWKIFEKNHLAPYSTSQQKVFEVPNAATAHFSKNY